MPTKAAISSFENIVQTSTVFTEVYCIPLEGVRIRPPPFPTQPTVYTLTQLVKNTQVTRYFWDIYRHILLRHCLFGKQLIKNSKFFRKVNFYFFRITPTIQAGSLVLLGEDADKSASVTWRPGGRRVDMPRTWHPGYKDHPSPPPSLTVLWFLICSQKPQHCSLS